MDLSSAPERPEGNESATSSNRGRRTASEGIIASSGIAFKLWRLYQHFWLVCLLFPLVSLVRTPESPVHLGLGLGALIFFAVSYTWLMWSHPASRVAQSRARFWTQVGLFVVLVALAFVLSFTYGLAFLWLFIGVSACAGVLFPLIGAFVVVSLLMVLPVLISLLAQGNIEHVDWPLTIALLLLVRGLGLDMIGLARMGRAIRELYTARRELARLAVAEERLRVARDLHDLLGHTLSMIALQSELEGAQQLLEAAGIDHQVDPTALRLPPAIDAVLAWVVREGVTNVVRHSRARHCRIQVTQTAGWVRIAVTNDERKPSTPEFEGLIIPAPGSGLHGIAERVRAQGGKCDAGPIVAPSGVGFRLQVELPVPLSEQQGNRAVLVKTDHHAEEEAVP